MDVQPSQHDTAEPSRGYDADAVPTTLVELLRARSLRHPDRRAYTFLIDGEAEGAHLSYGDVDRRARIISALLQRHCAAGERVLLLYPSGLDYISAFFGCVYAGVVTISVYPPRSPRHLPRLRAIVTDSQATIALTTRSLLPIFKRQFAGVPEMARLRWHTTDDLTQDRPPAWRDPLISADALAYLQYTSGSTGAPKGVMINHTNLLHNLAHIGRESDHMRQGVSLNWLPHFHDMGLIYGILTPLFKGFPSFVMPPMSFIQRPIRWLQAISRFRVTDTGGPNFAYDLCVRRSRPEQVAGLELSSWSVAITAGEPVLSDTLDRFAEAFAGCGFHRRAFHPAYGLAEATLIVSLGLKSNRAAVFNAEAGPLQEHRLIEAPVWRPDTRTSIGCGPVIVSTKLMIVNPDSGARCAPDRIGEIWLAGPGVAGGYWRRPEQTRRTFGAYLANSGEGPFLRTGDLGFVARGEVFVMGRLEDLIVIDDRNHYPDDIERTVEACHPALRQTGCAAFAVEIAGQRRLVVAAEVGPPSGRGVDSAAIVTTIRRAVAERHDLLVHSVVLLKAGHLPKTSSGKLQRHACRGRFLAGHLEVWGGNGASGAPADTNHA